MTWTRRGLLAAGVTALAGCVGGEPGTRIGFVGDVMLGRSVNDHWIGRDPDGVWGSTLNRLRRLDGLVLNLECCISERGRKWPDKVYYFRSDPDFAVPALESANAALASLANNHSLDFRAPALADTRGYLDDADIAHAGAGPSREAALTPAVTDIGGLTVAVVALTDRYPEYAAGDGTAGTAYLPLDPSVPESRQTVEATLRRARDADPDLLAVSLHWGPNWETAPSETQRRFARWLIDRGVDVVHGHSAHVLQGVEVYRGRPIVYDAGDFVDDYIDKESVQNKRSALFELTVEDGSVDSLRIVPTEIADETATMADEQASAWVCEAIRERSAAFGTRVDRTDAGLSVSLGEP
ncbi:CapA family protein [Halovenus sp. WSH3]|uniref:CapA family protein n=1 Tax=Halovenus carboxidivorans TaxID=2692199 RepID=A0A6B0T3C6_9EURY|nr:CapA family protein [Halovenus carboxidivorans]MXR52768.1 CapA family protein [Halovenus carboxidivorans]